MVSPWGYILYGRDALFLKTIYRNNIMIIMHPDQKRYKDSSVTFNHKIKWYNNGDKSCDYVSSCTFMTSLIWALITGPRIPSSFFLCLSSALSLNVLSLYWVNTTFLYFLPIRWGPCFKYFIRKSLSEIKWGKKHYNGPHTRACPVDGSWCTYPSMFSGICGA